ncbi:hypothetical protein GCM10018772_05580 [Streptomyces fumanus]|uniref:Uncharacterized protein n=1 Tax=Streptomyces fumanus TaxID=67302 RepID=A0A919DW64_9ACTN|nr:hypothetical protein GCM10018772_05580 [Streptomyces fumanus]
MPSNVPDNPAAQYLQAQRTALAAQTGWAPAQPVTQPIHPAPAVNTTWATWAKQQAQNLNQQTKYNNAPHKDPAVAGMSYHLKQGVGPTRSGPSR